MLTRALDRLAGLVIIGDDLPNSEMAVSFCRPGVYASVGLHPYHGVDLDEDVIEHLRALAANPGVKAIGEIGLDYYNEFSPRPAQRTAFVRQLELAAALKLPVIIHNRHADDDALAILTEAWPALPGGIMHCFGSGPRFAEQCVELGLYVSFAGNVTFPKADPLRAAACVVPLERLLVETDAPYLAPLPHRGKRCEPIFVEHTAAALAALKGVPLQIFANATTNNARTVYGLEHRDLGPLERAV